MGEIIRFLKAEFPAYRIAVLTNGSLLPDPEVRADLMEADLVIPTLNAVSDPAFRKINLPHREFSQRLSPRGSRDVLRLRRQTCYSRTPRLCIPWPTLDLPS